MRRTLGMICLVALVALLAPRNLPAQDTTQAYPWRLSYFPYPTAEPLNGVMGEARLVYFRASRWDARTSTDAQVATDAGYSTNGAWLLRARADLPSIVPGWRFEFQAEAGRRHLAELAAFGFGVDDPAELWSRQAIEAEVTRRIVGPLSLAARGGWVRASRIDEAHPDLTETDSDTRGRIALVLDLRDREYDTRCGALLQGGYIIGAIHGTYHGGYALASGWLPLGDATRLSARAGLRILSAGSGHEIVGYGGASPDAWQTIPAWEDEFTVGGGWESNRALPPGYLAGRRVYLASADLQHDLKVFPGGALTLLAFVDAGRTGTEYVAFETSDQMAPATEGPLQDWIVGAGGGVALRLLRAARIAATISRGAGTTQFYLQSGWSW